MTYYRLKVVFFVLLNSLVPALVAAMVSFGSGDHVCTTGNGASGTCQEKHVEIYPRSDFSLDCAENFACEDSTIVVGSGSTFTGDFVCGADGRPSFNGCKDADITVYKTDMSTYKVSCQYSGGTANSCQQTEFTMVDTDAEIQCDSGECQDMVVHVCGDSHVHVSGSLDAGNPIDVNLYGDDATVAVDETGAFTISNFASEQCPVAFFSCSDSCMIFAEYVDDGACDCPECEDEVSFICDRCSNGCPGKCGDRNTCSNFVCNDGCIISDAYVDDGYCDCPNCADESNFNCDSCDCPETCGDYNECFPTTSTLTPTTTTSKPTTTTLTPTTTTSTPTTTTTTPTTTSKPTTTTLKPTTTTLKPTTTTTKPTSTTRKPSTTALKPTTTEETTEEPGTGEPVTSDIENTAEPQTSEQLIDWTTTDDVSDSGNDKANSALETLEWVLMSVGFCAIVICVAFFVERKWRKKQKTKEVETAVEKPSAVELKVDTLTTAVPKKVEVAGMCHVSAAPPRLAVELKLGVCHDTQDTANTAQSTESTEVPHTDSEVAVKVKAEHLDLGHERNTTRGTTDGEDGEWEIDEDKYEELEDFWGL